MHNLEQRYDRRWDLIVLGAVANLCLGTVYSWSVFRGPLKAAFGFTASQTGTPYSVFLALFAFTMPIGGWLQSRIGGRLTMIAGAILVGAGWVSAGRVSTIAALSATYGVLGGFGVGLAYGVPLAVVGSWFPTRRGLALGITLTGFGLSPFVTAPIAELLIVRLGVSAAFRVLGFGFLAILSILTLWFKAAPGGGASSKGVGDVDLHPGQMIRSKAFYGLWICFALGTFAGLTAIGMSASYGEEVVGLSPGAAAAAVAAFGVFNGIGRPVFGWVTDAVGTRKAAYIAFVLILVGAVLAGQSGVLGIVVYLAGFAVLWMLLGGWLAIAPAATTRAFGPRRYAANYGIVYTAYGVGALGGGAVSALLTSATGTLTTTFWAIAAVAVLGLVVARVLLPAR